MPAFSFLWPLAGPNSVVNINTFKSLAKKDAKVLGQKVIVEGENVFTTPEALVNELNMYDSMYVVISTSTFIFVPFLYLLRSRPRYMYLGT